MKRKLLKPADAMLWLILFIATISAIAWFDSGKSGRFVNIIAPSGNRTVGLGEDQTFTVEGKEGKVMIEIHDGSAAIAESPCPRGLCKHQGFINRVGQSVVCLPEGIKLEICDSADTYDAVIH